MRCGGSDQSQPKRQHQTIGTVAGPATNLGFPGREEWQSPHPWVGGRRLRSCRQNAQNWADISVGATFRNEENHRQIGLRLQAAILAAVIEQRLAGADVHAFDFADKQGVIAGGIFRGNTAGEMSEGVMD